jgi:NADP-dependent 3-hydroxy acid dehydrogenase YdfG
MKNFLIIGGSKGIGNECANYFRNLGHDVTTVARTNADILGDITNSDFRNELVKNHKKDVIVNCAGTHGVPVEQALTINYVAATDLLFRFYQELSEGSDIINISSIASSFSEGHSGISNERISYNTSKNAISDVCLSLSKKRTRDIRVTTLEPGMVMPTHFDRFTNRTVDENVYINYDFNQFAPIKSSYIGEVIEWIIGQPRWVNICSMAIINNFHHTKNS